MCTEKSYHLKIKIDFLREEKHLYYQCCFVERWILSFLLYNMHFIINQIKIYYYEISMLKFIVK